MAKFCGTCGAQMDDAAKVCGLCGAVMNAAPAAVKTEKFCANCGALVEDAANVCGVCGAPVTATAKTVTSISAMDPEKRAKVKKYTILGGIAAAAVAVLIIAIVLIVKFTGYRGLLRKTLNAYEDYDLSALVEITSEARLKNTNHPETYYKNIVGSELSYFEGKLGHGYDLSFETQEVYEVEKRSREVMEEQIRYDFPEYDLAAVDEIMCAEIQITAERNERTCSRILTVTMVKENGNWALLYMD